MGKKATGRVGRHATRAKSGREGSDDEESESGDLSGTSSEKQRLVETREELREAKEEALRLAALQTETDNRFEVDEEEDDDDDATPLYTHEEDELAAFRTQNAELVRSLQRKPGAASLKLSTWKPGSLPAMSPLLSLVMRSKSATLLSTTLTLPLPTSRSFVRFMRPNVKPILIAQTQPPMPPLRVQLTTIFRTRADSHIFDVFRNAPITLRILVICESYSFFLCLCLYSTYLLALHILLLWPHFGFDMLFDLSALLFALREAFKLQPVKRETALYSFIFVHIPYFYFSITGYFYFRRVVRNDSLVRRLRRQRSRPCAVGRLGTIERRRRVTVLVKP